MPENKLTVHPNPLAWIANTLDAVPMREAPSLIRSRKKRPGCSFRIAIPQIDFWWLLARVFDHLATADEALLKARHHRY